MTRRVFILTEEEPAPEERRIVTRFLSAHESEAAALHARSRWRVAHAPAVGWHGLTWCECHGLFAVVTALEVDA